MSVEVVSLDELFLHDEIVRLKNKISKMNKILFIFSSIPKVKYYGWVYYDNPLYNINRFVLQEYGILLGGCLTVKN